MKGSDPMYAVVVTGECSEQQDVGRLEFREGYVLFTADGTVPFLKAFHPGYEPGLTEPFGAAVNMALRDDLASEGELPSTCHATRSRSMPSGMGPNTSIPRATTSSSKAWVRG